MKNNVLRFDNPEYWHLHSLKIFWLPFLQGVLLIWGTKVKKTKTCFYFKLCRFSITDPCGFLYMVHMLKSILPLLISVQINQKVTSLIILLNCYVYLMSTIWKESTCRAMKTIASITFTQLHKCFILSSLMLLQIKI